MPELPEVETIRRQLDPQLAGRRIASAWSFDSPRFAAAVGAADYGIDAVRRRGKYLILDLTPSGGGAGRGSMGRLTRGHSSGASRELIVHLGMTGGLRVLPARSGDPYVRAWWSLTDGRALEFRDVRRFGRIALVHPGRYDDLPTLAALGPEPDDPAFDPDALWRGLRASRTAVKTRLLSQRVVAGLGNIYVDEALWLAGVDPGTRRVTRAQAERLHPAIVEVLAAGVHHGGTTLRDYRDADGRRGENQHHLQCYGRAGLPCRRCGHELERRIVDQRGTTWCRVCQGRAAR